MNKIKITIGICARNEDKNIVNCLESVRKNIMFLSNFDVKVVINVNGSTDKTESYVEDYIINKKLTDFFIINTGENLVEAQRNIVENFKSDFQIFIDADVILDEQTITKLIEVLIRTDKIVVYADYVPQRHNFKKWNILKRSIQALSILYDTNYSLQTKRYYLHGRVFATKDWFAPTIEESISRAENSKLFLIKNLPQKQKTLIIDDVYYSSYILDKYGLNSIERIEKAYVYYYPICTLRDMYKIYRRRNLEMIKLTNLYPEYNYLLPYLNRKTIWYNLLFKTSFNDKVLWVLWMILKKSYKFILILELVKVYLGKDKNFQQWLIPETSKAKIK